MTDDEYELFKAISRYLMSEAGDNREHQRMVFEAVEMNDLVYITKILHDGLVNKKWLWVSIFDSISSVSNDVHRGSRSH